MGVYTSICGCAECVVFVYEWMHGMCVRAWNVWCVCSSVSGRVGV